MAGKFSQYRAKKKINEYNASSESPNKHESYAICWKEQGKDRFDEGDLRLEI